MSNTRDTSSIVLRGSVQKGTPAQPSVTHKIAMSACGARFQNNDGHTKSTAPPHEMAMSMLPRSGRPCSPSREYARARARVHRTRRGARTTFGTRGNVVTMNKPPQQRPGLKRLPPEFVRSVRVAGSALFTSLPPETAQHLSQAVV